MNKYTIGFWLVVGLLLTGVKPGLAQTNNFTDFVKRDGKTLTLSGQPFTFIGVNRDNAPTDNAANSCGDGGENPELYLNTMFDHLKNSCNGTNTNMVMRIWAFQSYTNYNAANGLVDFSQIDRVVDKAEQAGVRLVMTLENQWGDCTKCINDSGDCRKLNTWYKDGYKLWKKGYTGNHGYNYPLTYKEYVGKIVDRYKNRKVIMMWQLMNEAESETASLGSDPTSMYNFTEDMANYIKSIDPNHLISVGTIGTENPGIEFEKLHSIANIDILETHDYGKPVTTNPSLHHSYVDSNLATASKLNKPIFIGEGGIKKGEVSSLTERASMLDQKMKAYIRQGGDGYLVWAYTEGKLDPYYQSSPYDFSATDPICTVMKNYNQNDFDNTPPTVSINSPLANASVTKYSTVKIEVNASDSGSGMNKVIVYANGSKICTDTSAPYSCDWNTGGRRTVTIKAVGYDLTGNSTTKTITVYVK